jgi:pimeloyl-ACP methyl ester carboxylesterase
VNLSFQYARTRDGVTVAYSVAGAGPPLVRVQGALWDHCTGYWRVSPAARQLARLARHFTHIQGDVRGVGLSPRGGADFSIDAQVADLEAVVDANHLESFDLLGHMTGGPAAITYAARHPEKVQRLLLFSPHLRGADYFASVAIRAFAGYRSVAADDWQGYLQTLAMRTLRFSEQTHRSSSPASSTSP